eukprot:8146211-Ditylum_brightwellii.AAC.1
MVIWVPHCAAPTGPHQHGAHHLYHAQYLLVQSMNSCGWLVETRNACTEGLIVQQVTHQTLPCLLVPNCVPPPTYYMPDTWKPMQRFVELSPTEAATLEEFEANMDHYIDNDECILDKGDIKPTIRKYNGLMWPHMFAYSHPEKEQLHQYALERFPVECSDDWLDERVEKAL